MYKGIKHKPEHADVQNLKAEEKKPGFVETIKEALTPEPKKAAPVKPALPPLEAGQAHFEAPDGTIIIGEATRDQVWYRAGNDGKGMWINKRR